MYVEPNLKDMIYDMLPVGKETISSLVAKSIGTSPRKALDILSVLECEGLVSSEMKKVRFNSSSSRCRVFVRVR